jgi:hypothetical protein
MTLTLKSYILTTYQLYKQLQNKQKICHIYFISYIVIIVNLKYSQTCIKRSPLSQRKYGRIRQVTS